MWQFYKIWLYQNWKRRSKIEIDKYKKIELDQKIIGTQQANKVFNKREQGK